jgi:excisionase family DNA binding protein
MNLADAIRKASATALSSPLMKQISAHVEAAPRHEELTVDEDLAEVEMNEQEWTPEEAPRYEVAEATAPVAEAGPGQHVVRLELALSQEQLNGLFRAVLTSPHSILTPKEAAAYLRIKVRALEEMAAAGEIPAYEVDGKWRFSKVGIDEWLAAKAVRKECA